MTSLLGDLPNDLDIAATVSQISQLGYLTTAFKDLAEIHKAIEASNKDNQALNGLVMDVFGAITLLASWAAKVSKSSIAPALDDGVKELIMVLEHTLHSTKRQLSRHRLLNFVLHPNYTKKIQESRRRLQNAKDNFVSLSSLHVGISQYADISKTLDQITMQMSNNGRRSEVLNELRGRCALGACHDSSAREGVAKCLETTRGTIIYKILAWFNEPENPHRVLWMYGPAGSGKTTIAQTIADILAKQGFLGASFFWSGSAPNRPTTKDHFVVTIVYQLCIAIPDLSEFVASTLQRDPELIYSNNLSRQMEQLIILPLQDLYVAKREYSVMGNQWLLVIDGIDECVDFDSQEEIIRLLVELLNHIPFPLRILFCSRDDCVMNTTLKSTYPSADLDPEFISLFDVSDTEKDIRTMFEFRFKQIKEQHAGWALCLADGPIPEELNNWPTQDAVDTLVAKSAGLFIYADASMNYIEDPYCHPVERSREVLSKDDLSFDELDQLYAKILQRIPDEFSEEIQAVLHWLIFGEEENKLKALCDKVFGFDPQHSTVLLSHIASVIHVPLDLRHTPESSKSLRVLHVSFPNFLQDRLRLQRHKVEKFYCDTVVGPH